MHPDGSVDENHALASGPRRLTTVTLSLAALAAEAGPRARRPRLRMTRANLMNRCTLSMPPLRPLGSYSSPWGLTHGAARTLRRLRGIDRARLRSRSARLP